MYHNPDQMYVAQHTAELRKEADQIRLAKLAQRGNRAAIQSKPLSALLHRVQLPKLAQETKPSLQIKKQIAG
jgi:hypothetical protein